MTRVVEAAALMKTRAEDATPGTWSKGDNEVTADADLVYDDPRWPGKPILPFDGPMEVASCYREERRGERQANAQHIASLHPGVASVIADALTAIEAAAGWGDWPSVTAALNRVAEAYLGAES